MVSGVSAGWREDGLGGCLERRKGRRFGGMGREGRTGCGEMDGMGVVGLGWCVCGYLSTYGV